MSDQYEDLQQSYGRCLRDKHFIERFYQTFLASSPAIPPVRVERLIRRTMRTTRATIVTPSSAPVNRQPSPV